MKFSTFPSEVSPGATVVPPGPVEVYPVGVVFHVPAEPRPFKNRLVSARVVGGQSLSGWSESANPYIPPSEGWDG